jgi:hypothetical protein
MISWVGLQKHRKQRQKIDNWNYIKLSSSTIRETINSVKNKKLWKGENLRSYSSGRKLMYRIYKELKKT